MTLLIRFLLAVSLLVSGGQGNTLIGLQGTTIIGHASAHALEKAAKASIVTGLNVQQAISYKSIQPAFEKVLMKIFVEESEDEDESCKISFYKKGIEALHPFSNFFAYHNAGYCRFTSKRLPAISHFTFVPAYRYILLRVFRI